MLYHEILVSSFPSPVFPDKDKWLRSGWKKTLSLQRQGYWKVLNMVLILIFPLPVFLCADLICLCLNFQLFFSFF